MVARRRVIRMNFPKKAVAAVAAVVAAIYILNPTMGIFELFPDNVPGLGNLDEAGMTALLIWALHTLRGKHPPQGPS